MTTTTTLMPPVSNDELPYVHAFYALMSVNTRRRWCTKNQWYFVQGSGAPHDFSLHDTVLTNEEREKLYDFVVKTMPQVLEDRAVVKSELLSVKDKRTITDAFTDQDLEAFRLFVTWRRREKKGHIIYFAAICSMYVATAVAILNDPKPIVTPLTVGVVGVFSFAISAAVTAGILINSANKTFTKFVCEAYSVTPIE